MRGKALHHTVVPLRGNERSVLDREETTGEIVPMPSDATCDWLRALHRAFCGEHTRHQPSRCEAAAEAHLEAIERLLSIFGKVCETDHPSTNNPEIEIIQSLSQNYFVSGRNAGTASPAARQWNDSSPATVRKRIDLD